MSFHECSAKVYNWLQKQPHVKEESLTDWLLYQISEKCPQVYYQAFTKHEESVNGCDWEWWILTRSCIGNSNYSAYRFLVQAKKLQPGDKDNYPLLAYSNKNGIQIELLKESAEIKNALPVYLYYSAASADIDVQIENFPWLKEQLIRRCEKCINGCYIAFASKVCDLLFQMPRHKLTDADLINRALKLSLMDYLIKAPDIEGTMVRFNSQLLEMKMVGKNGGYGTGVSGIKHFGAGIPEYLKIFVNSRGKDVEWLQSEMRLDDMSGLGVLDFRDAGVLGL